MEEVPKEKPEEDPPPKEDKEDPEDKKRTWIEKKFKGMRLLQYVNKWKQD